MEKEVVKSGGERWVSFIKWLGLLYLFILAIELMKKSAVFIGPFIQDFFVNGLSAVKAISVGWFTTAVAQSSGAIGAITATFAGSNFLSLSTAVFILIGASLGTTITALIISLLVDSKNKRDFRHGFEIGLCYAIYGVILLIVVFILEYFFKLFSKLSYFLAFSIQDKIPILEFPDFIQIITNPIIKLFSNVNEIFIIFLALGILIFSLKYLGKATIEVLGGEKKARGFIHKYFDSKYKAYFIGVFITVIVFSSSITIGLLVPLAASRMISLKKAIPFILGADVGTSTDMFLASIVIGQTNALAVAFAYFLFAIVGTLLFLPNVEKLNNTTKYFTKKLIGISRRKALYILIAFILIPLLLIFLL